MGFRFSKRIKIAPGVSLNLSKSGPSLSVGPRGAKVNLSKRGVRVGIPGTGGSYSYNPFKKKTTKGKSRSKGKGKGKAAADEDRLTMGFFKRLVTPKKEEALIDGCRELAAGHELKSLDHLRDAVHLADGAYLAGIISLKRKKYDDAAEYLSRAEEAQDDLGSTFRKYEISPTVDLQVTEEVTAHVGPDLTGVLLGLVEAQQRLGQTEEAIGTLRRLLEYEPDDVVARLSLVELLIEEREPTKAAFEEVLTLTGGATNESPVHAALLLYKAKALRRIGMQDVARDVLTTTMRRKKDRSPELMRSLRYERALVYEELGDDKRSRAELEKVYAEDPGFEDVADRLGI